jgi:predicted  nucleic acid-binding Zn-ribbon protein
MKGPSLIALLAWIPACLARADPPSPVSRVAQLLKELAEKIDSELDAETQLYEDYVCWGKAVISSKTTSNVEAQARIDSLKTYVADLEAGRIELTSERTDLTNEINELNGNLETAKALREKEKADYEAASKEFDQGIKALEEAIEVLEEASKEDAKTGFVSLRATVARRAMEGQSQGFGARAAEADALQKAVDVGSRWLSSGDALFLQRLLSGEVPKQDWKKLNRKAEFKMKYKVRSEKIQATLKKLLADFKSSKEEADKKEEAAQAQYETLKESKEGQLKTSQESLNKMEEEGGAQALSKSDAEAEIKSLEDQIEADKKFITETEEKLKKKKEEYAKRKELRLGEIKACNEAIAIIRSDDARDLFKRSLASQKSPSFLQVRDVTTSATARAGAAIRDAARASRDSRLSALAARVSLESGGKFDVVLKAIDDMVTKLEKEGEEDKTNKKECETNREKDTKDAADLSRDMDELTDGIAKLEEEIEEIVKEVKEKEESIKKLEEEIKEAKKIRKAESAEWVKSDADDTEAAKLLEDAAEVLKTFYKENFSLLQKHRLGYEPPEVEAGEAPPPPPKTWEGDYEGQTEHKGIVSILEEIKKDVEEDQKKAKEAEDDAQKEHEKFVTDSEKEVEDLKTDINDLETSKAEKETDIKSKKEEHKTKDGTLGEVIKRMKEAAAGCDFILVNFKIREDNRKLEIEGLKKAKEILEKENK